MTVHLLKNVTLEETFKASKDGMGSYSERQFAASSPPLSNRHSWNIDKGSSGRISFLVCCDTLVSWLKSSMCQYGGPGVSVGFCKYQTHSSINEEGKIEEMFQN